MNHETTHPDPCQVDFYLLGDTSMPAENFACRLAMMAWERRQEVFICVDSNAAINQLDELMWHNPQGRFLPHAGMDDPNSVKAPLKICTFSGLKPADVVINLCPEAIPQPARFGRVLEIVPFLDDERKASRVKYKTYCNQGLKPRTHEINK